ncbi:MAG: amidase [Armatimonadetes bacterium]|nr:amidase [Armatimonadota bacterium]
MADLPFLPVTELSRLLDRREISPVDIVRAVLDRIETLDGVLCGYITLCGDAALEAARVAERETAAGCRRGPLHGIPVAHKDVSWTKGVRTTAHSRSLLDFVPEEDATHVRRLADAGMILLGKTNTGEFACGTTDLFGTPRNPWDLTRYTGGSSNGSANAVAAGLAVVATGTDTGGSIRCPSGLCGIVGLKPAFGRVSRHGIIPLSWSMDHVGPMTRTVADAALMLNAMAGQDPRDPTTASGPVPDFTAGLGEGIRGMVLGIPRQHFYEALHPEVDAAMRAALRHLEGLGARLEPVDLPRARDLGPVGPLMYRVEAFAVHAERLRSRGHLYGRRARQKICSGAFYTAADYQQAARVRESWIQELAQVMRRVDALVTPTLRIPAFTLEEQEQGPPDTSWGTHHFNMSGHPAITVPCGFTAGGLPIAMQIVGRSFDEVTVLRIAHAYEQSTDWHRRRPDERGWPRARTPLDRKGVTPRVGDA